MDGLVRGHLEFCHQAGYVLRPPSSGTTARSPLLVVLHGQGMSGEQMMRLLDLQGDGRFVLAGDGPFPFEKRREKSIEIGYGWYLYRGDQDEFRRQLERSERHVLNLVDEVCARHPIDPQRVAIVGYSQGGYLAGFIALRRRRPFRAMVLMSSRLKHEFLHDELRAGDLPATLFIHSTDDQAVLWESTREGRDRLAAGGAEIELQLHDEGHRVPSGAGRTIDRWLAVRGL